MPTSWTPPQVTIHPVGPWSLPQATAWRQAEADELAFPLPGPAPLPPPPTVPLAASTLAAWLRDAGRSTSLHLAVAVGGEAPAQAWLGLSQRAETAPAALRALREHTEDLGALLDAWAWFRAPGATPPPELDQPALHLSDATGEAGALLEVGMPWSPPTLPRVLLGLVTWPRRLTLHVSITPAVADVALVQAAEQAARQAVASDERAFPWDSNPLTEQALRLHGQVTASIVHLSLHADPLPGRALCTWLGQALSRDLGGDVAFSAEVQPLRVHGTRAQRVLEALNLRAGEDLGEDDGGREEGAPF